MALGELEGNHGASVFGLLLVNLKALMAGQPRIVDLLHLQAALQPLSQVFGILHMAVQSHPQCLDAPQEQESILGPQHPAGGILDKGQLLRQLPGACHRQACHQITVAPQVLGGAVHHYIRPQSQRLLQIWGHKGIIHNNQHPMLVGQLCHRPDIRDGQQGIGRALNDDALDLRGKGFLKGRQIFCVLQGIIYLEVVEHLVQQTEGTPVDIAGKQDFLTALEQAQHRCDSCQARGKGKTCFAAFQLGNQRFQSRPGRIAGTGILPALPQLPQTILPKGGGLVDGHSDGPSMAVPVHAPVNQKCIKGCIAHKIAPFKITVSLPAGSGCFPRPAGGPCALRRSGAVYHRDPHGYVSQSPRQRGFPSFHPENIRAP